MKKSAVLAGAVVFAAAAYTGVSWYVGVQAQETIRTVVGQANDRVAKTLGPDLAALGMRIEITEYRRGIFSSSARYTLSVQDDDERLELGLDDHMQHGPFPWALLKQGEMTPLLAYSRSQLVDTESVKRWFDAARGVMPLEVDTRIGFGGDGVSSWNFAPLEWAVEGDRLSFSGGQMQVRFSKDFRDSTGDARFASLVVGDAAEASTVAMNDIRLDSRTSTGADDAVQVHSTVKIATLAVTEANEETLSLADVTATLDSTQKGKQLDAALRYDFGRLRAGDIDLGSMSVGGKLARFNFEAFSALLAEYDAIASEHDAEEGEAFDLTPEDEKHLIARLRPVLASSPEAALQPVVWRNEKGESTLAVAAAFQPVPGDGPEVSDEALMQALRELRIEVVLSRPMVLQAFAQTGSDAAEKEQLEMLAALMFDRYVEELERDGLVHRDGERATMTIVYGNGVVDVNEQKMSVEEFLALFGAFLM